MRGSRFPQSCAQLDTDRIFHELFRDHPEWLRELTGLPLPEGCQGSSRILKQLEIRCDLLLESANPDDPRYLVEFQLYHDHSIFNRIELARQLLWKHLHSRTDCRRRDFSPGVIEAVVLFGSRTELPSSSDRYPQIRFLFLDEMLESLRRKRADSPLLAALAPLSEPAAELEKDAASLYRQIQSNAELETEDREVLTEIFLNLLLQRFKTKSRKEIRKMIAELTPLHETRAGRELLEEGIEEGMKKGIEKGIESLVRRMSAKGKSALEISELTDLSVDQVSRILQARDD